MENQLKVNFSYTDRFGQVSELNKTYNEKVLESYKGNDISLILDTFEQILSSLGFPIDDINRGISIYNDRKGTHDSKTSSDTITKERSDKRLKELKCWVGFSSKDEKEYVNRQKLLCDLENQVDKYFELQDILKKNGF